MFNSAAIEVMEQRPTLWDYLASLLLFIFGMQLGFDFPDIDQRVPYLLHRSLLTHGVIVPALFFLMMRKSTHPAPRWFAMGFLVASTVHLAFDFFPKAWRGFALISIPFYGRTSSEFSWFWIGAGSVICLYLALLLIHHVLEVLVNVIGLIASFILHGAGERVGMALLFLLCAVGVAFALPSRAARVVKGMMQSN